MDLETPQISAIVVQDNEGGRIAAKFFDRQEFRDKLTQTEFEKKLFRKTKNSTSRGEAEVLLLDGMNVVYKVSSDVTFFIVGSGDENELILVALLDALYEALALLIKGPVDKRSVMHHLELLLLAIDELVDGGIPFEMEARAIFDRVMLRGAVPESISSYNEMTVGAIVEKTKDRLAKQFAK